MKRCSGEVEVELPSDPQADRVLQRVEARIWVLATVSSWPMEIQKQQVRHLDSGMCSMLMWNVIEASGICSVQYWLVQKKRFNLKRID